MANGNEYRLTLEAIAARKSWQVKAVAFTHGNKSQIGALVLAMLGVRLKPPCFHPCGLQINKAGQVLALFDSNNGFGFVATKLYDTVQEFTDVFRGLADALQLSDTDTDDLFGEVRKFIKKDDRAKSELF